MSIFSLEENKGMSNTPSVKATKTELTWINLGVEFLLLKRNGMTSKRFADERGINYSTFTKSMSRYKAKIELAYEAEKAKNKPSNKLTRREREAIMINSYRQSIRAKIANDGARVNNKTEKWFTETLAKGVRSHTVVKPSPGKIYAYIYDAKHKDTLPFWDRFPLIIFLGFSETKGGTMLFHGLNLHYIPPKARQEFLESLLKQYSSTPVISNSTKLKIDWSKVKSFRGADKMIKAYLPDHVKGKFVEIKPADWANVTLMPLQQFVSGGKRYSATKVWNNK